MATRLKSPAFNKGKGFDHPSNADHSVAVESGSKQERDYRSKGWTQMTDFEIQQAAARDQEAHDRQRQRDRNDAALKGRVLHTDPGEVRDVGADVEHAEDVSDAGKAEAKEARKAAPDDKAQQKADNAEALERAKQEQEAAERQARPLTGNESHR